MRAQPAVKYHCWCLAPTALPGGAAMTGVPSPVAGPACRKTMQNAHGASSTSTPPKNMWHHRYRFMIPCVSLPSCNMSTTMGQSHLLHHILCMSGRGQEIGGLGRHVGNCKFCELCAGCQGCIVILAWCWTILDVDGCQVGECSQHLVAPERRGLQGERRRRHAGSLIGVLCQPTLIRSLVLPVRCDGDVFSGVARQL